MLPDQPSKNVNKISFDSTLIKRYNSADYVSDEPRPTKTPTASHDTLLLHTPPDEENLYKPELNTPFPFLASPLHEAARACPSIYNQARRQPWNRLIHYLDSGSNDRTT